jgi:hypothetical protein
MQACSSKPSSTCTFTPQHALQDEREGSGKTMSSAWLAPSAAVALAPPPEVVAAVAAAAAANAPQPGSFVVLPDDKLADTSPAIALLRRQARLPMQQ